MIPNTGVGSIHHIIAWLGLFNVKPRLRAPPQEGNACEVQGQVMQAWLDRAGDPETEIEGWCDDGVGIGINRQIKYCNVFPPIPE